MPKYQFNVTIDAGSQEEANAEINRLINSAWPVNPIGGAIPLKETLEEEVKTLTEDPPDSTLHP